MSADDETRILLVGLADTIDRQLTAALKNRGFEVESVSAASDCLRRVRKDDIDGIISEYSLPEFDGLQLLRSLRMSQPDLPFLVVPADGSETIAGEALAADADGYVPADSNLETIVTRLQSSLQGTTAQSEDESQYRYRSIVQTSPFPINIFDGSGEIIWCNDAVLDLLDEDCREELLGESIFEFIHPDDRENAREEITAVIEAKESTGPTQMKLRTAAGDIRYIHVSTATGSFFGTDIGQAIIVDLTEQEERKRQLQIFEQWLRHNIRNEMTVIHGMAESIHQGFVDDATDCARRIQDHAAHLVEQANHERKIVSLISERSDPVVTDLTAVIDRQVAKCRKEFPTADIEITQRAEITTRAVPEIGDAIQELLDNAIQHNHTDTPVVKLELERTAENNGILRIIDNGPGIPDRETNNLLIGQKITPLSHGTGLGLVFVYWAVRRSGARITFDTNDPHGSRITLTFPLAADN
ncbi:ATP-binding protein [Haloarcula nitratireducens]|uniref:histidine kinase n=1 Tax=Haloarcula nitratireducens TaxID=2487749 RepID=A0AAW4PJE3_9EURY|nr:ATP-binding protein [Halomicroarcula nitratireducens]MBX0298247.1 response regulator [Halomicroarcula nitratireducens]